MCDGPTPNRPSRFFSTPSSTPNTVFPKLVDGKIKTRIFHGKTRFLGNFAFEIVLRLSTIGPKTCFKHELKGISYGTEHRPTPRCFNVKNIGPQTPLKFAHRTCLRFWFALIIKMTWKSLEWFPFDSIGNTRLFLTVTHEKSARNREKRMKQRLFSRIYKAAKLG